MIGQSRQGLEKLIDLFGRPDTPYLSQPRPENLGFGTYDHLARVKEWRGGGGDT